MDKDQKTARESETQLNEWTGRGTCCQGHLGMRVWVCITLGVPERMERCHCLPDTKPGAAGSHSLLPRPLLPSRRSRPRVQGPFPLFHTPPLLGNQQSNLKRKKGKDKSSFLVSFVLLWNDSVATYTCVEGGVKEAGTGPFWGLWAHWCSRLRLLTAHMCFVGVTVGQPVTNTVVRLPAFCGFS